MSRMHFEAIARTIAEQRESFRSNLAHAQFASDMAKTLAETNPRFDRPKFIMACMPKAWVGTKHSSAWERIASGDRY